MITNKLRKVAGWLGYIFCELSFHWFHRFDTPYGDDWRWYHHLSYFFGQKLYSVGSYFYDVEERK